MRKICLLGSTGSIGTQTLDVVRRNPDIGISALAAGGNVDLMEAQIREFLPETAVLFDEKKAADLKARVRDLPVRIYSGMEGLLEAVSLPSADLVLTAVVGMIGIRPTMAAIRAGKDVALANKETLVTAGHLIMPLAAEYGVRVLPVDSEHSAIFQCLQGNAGNRIDKILLTCSGGPFRGRKKEELARVRPEDALKHPNWAMGRKITIDSASLINKGLEVMEARWLFGTDIDDIEVVVHPQSVIHSMVQFEDGGIMAQLGTPDMRLPIQYALFYPERRPLPGKRLDFAALKSITFEAPDTDAFPGLALALRAGRRGGTLPVVFNAANEKAVSMFLDKKIGFTEIPELIAEAMDSHTVKEDPSLEEILAAEEETLRFAESRWKR